MPNPARRRAGCCPTARVWMSRTESEACSRNFYRCCHKDAFFLLLCFRLQWYNSEPGAPQTVSGFFPAFLFFVSLQGHGRRNRAPPGHQPGDHHASRWYAGLHAGTILWRRLCLTHAARRTLRKGNAHTTYTVPTALRITHEHTYQCRCAARDNPPPPRRVHPSAASACCAAIARRCRPRDCYLALPLRGRGLLWRTQILTTTTSTPPTCPPRARPPRNWRLLRACRAGRRRSAS